MIDFEIARARGFRAASLTREGPWKSDEMMRPYFSRILSWAAKRKLKTGRWIYSEVSGPYISAERRIYEASIELKDRKQIKAEGKITIRNFPATLVARVKFNPEVVSPRLVYHGLESWLEWRKRYGEYRRSGIFWTREIYSGDPWRSKTDWENTEVQVPIDRL